MKNAQNDLKKRLHSDTIITYILTAVIAVLSVVKMVHFFVVADSVRIAGEAYKGTAPGSVLSDSIILMFVAVTMLLLSLILREIHLTGKPFSKKNVNRLRGMGVLLMIAGFAPEIAKAISYMLDLNAGGASIQLPGFNGTSYCVMFFGVVCGLISEIFRYGCELQDNMDSIA